MLTIPHFCFLIIYFSLTKPYKSEYMFNDKGWRPITSGEVYKGLLTSFQKPNNIQNIDTSWSRYTPNEINLLTNDAIKLVKPQQVHREFEIKREGFLYPVKKETIEFINERPERLNKCETQGLEKCFEIGKITQATINNNGETETNKTTRKAKKISDDGLSRNSHTDVVVDQQNVRLEVDKINANQIRTSSNNIIEAYDKSYEVTENTQILDLAEKTKTEQTNIEDNTGYIYKPPDDYHFNSKHSNLTSTLLNILSKYKINEKDELHNYERSRILSNQGTFKPDLIYLPIPIRNIGSSNSLNHLPVNPLLAVLLSHYGYYLPGSYGLHNNYRNLYGYLASNNIHNNKPFGLYKIFSDTDSLNK